MSTSPLNFPLDTASKVTADGSSDSGSLSFSDSDLPLKSNSAILKDGGVGKTGFDLADGTACSSSFTFIVSNFKKGISES